MRGTWYTFCSFLECFLKYFLTSIGVLGRITVKDFLSLDVVSALEVKVGGY